MNIRLKEIELSLNPCEVYEAFRYERDTIILDSSKEDEGFQILIYRLKSIYDFL